MPRLIARIALATPAEASVAVRGGATLAMAAAGLAAIGLSADGASAEGALQALLAVALIVGAGGVAANFVRLPERTEGLATSEPIVPDAAAAETREPIAGVRVLLAEDNPLNQLVVHALLNGLVGSLTIVSDGVEALEALRRQDFDLVLMDVNMPHLDGPAAVGAVRGGEAGRRDIPIVALTAEALAGDAERLRAAGFDAYLAKPFRPAELLAVVTRWTHDRLSPRAASQPTGQRGRAAPTSSPALRSRAG